MKVTKDMKIGEFMQKYPTVVEILMAEGVHCMGCHGAMFESIEDGLKAHGKTDEQIDNCIKKINEALELEGNTEKEFTITKEAAEKLKGILEKEGKEGIRLSAQPGGCSGFQYQFEFEEKQKGDLEIQQHGVKFYVDEKSMECLKGCIIEFVETPQGSGFKITNPNATGCGCGH